MGAIVTLRNEIEAIIDLMEDCQYLRATSYEANIELDKTKINSCIAIHIDQSTATASQSNQNWNVKTIPTEIFFVHKQTNLDDKLYDLDSIVDKAEDKADQFHDMLIQSAIISDLETWEDYHCERREAFKLFDSIVTGVLFTWAAPVPRSKYYCN